MREEGVGGSAVGKRGGGEGGSTGKERTGEQKEGGGRRKRYAKMQACDQCKLVGFAVHILLG